MIVQCHCLIDLQIRDFRTDWDLQVNQLVAGNYYPVCLFMSMFHLSSIFLTTFQLILVNIHIFCRISALSVLKSCKCDRFPYHATETFLFPFSELYSRLILEFTCKMTMQNSHCWWIAQLEDPA